MKMSGQRKSDLFKAIYEPVTSLRVAFRTVKDDALDNALFQMQMEIWREVKKALNLKEPL